MIVCSSGRHLEVSLDEILNPKLLPIYRRLSVSMTEHCTVCVEKNLLYPLYEWMDECGLLCVRCSEQSIKGYISAVHLPFAALCVFFDALLYQCEYSQSHNATDEYKDSGLGANSD